MSTPKERKTRLLFVCSSNSCRSQMAEGLAKVLLRDLVDAHSAGVTATGVHPKAVQVMREADIDISQHKSKKISELGPTSFDLVITLCDEAKEYCVSPTILSPKDKNLPSPHEKSALFVGAPVHLHWPLVDPAKVEGAEEQVLKVFRNVREQIKGNLQILLAQGYLNAISCQRERLERLADMLASGIVAHDDNRNIYLFNRAAELTTGLCREDVLGRDCHQVFPPNGLCGSECIFKHGGPKDSEKSREYQLSFTTAKGEDKKLKVTTEPMEISDGNPGVLAVINDVTEVSELRWKLHKQRSFHGLIGSSPAIQEVFERIRSVSTSDYPVLVTGESGTGKELLANAIHNESRRKAGPFVPINCGALPDNILESELFGHVRGAFTGAVRTKKGRFELAHQGTIFLDEVGELSSAFQVKLLRVLQEKRFEMVGGEQTVHVDVRIISATNCDLRTMVKEGKFREDLYYRLCVVPIELPPLRERREDIPLLAEHTIARISEETGNPLIPLSYEAMDCFLHYDWPGNIRELINTLQFASVLCKGDTIFPKHLPPEVRGKSIEESSSPTLVVENKIPKKNGLTKQDIKLALTEAGGNKVKAAKLLGVGRATLYRHMKGA
ncbi:MAG: sigma 54-interacting transcriptional regulator [Pseudomonadota bacterium]